MSTYRSSVLSALLGRTTDEEAPAYLNLPDRSNLSPLGFVWHVSQGRFRNWLLGIFAGETGGAVCGILLPVALGKIITGVTRSHGDPRDILRSLYGPLAFFAALCLGEFVFGRTSSFLQLQMAPRQRQYVARALFRHLHRHSHRFLTDNFAGALAHRVAETSHGVNQVTFAALTEFWPIAIVIVVANVLLAATNRWLGAFVGIWSLVFVVLSLRLARRTQPLAAKASTARSRTVGQLVDSVTNHLAVRLFARLGHEQDRLNTSYGSELSDVLRANHAMEKVRLFQFAASAVLKAGIVSLSVWLWSRGAIGVGQFVMSVSLSLLVISEVRNLGRRFLEFFESLGNVGSGVRALLQPLDLVDEPRAAVRKIRAGAIEFDRVHFRYHQGAEVFRNLSVTIPAGQRVGLVGLSGSGKSTFVSLLLRLHDIQAGGIRIDGTDLREFTQDSLHAQVGLIPQDPTLFHRTLGENIRYGRPEASEEDLSAASRAAHADEFIRALVGGYDGEVGERGVKLSGGQRQRIAIARVILKDAPILLLDEATSSLDSLTEKAIQETLDRTMAGKTVVVIAHRLSTIAHLDRILVFDRGRIAEDGTHKELLARKGAYFQLWNRQDGGALPEETSPSVAETSGPDSRDSVSGSADSVGDPWTSRSAEAALR
jgi:ATP-binding cassette subfamily B protein